MENSQLELHEGESLVWSGAPGKTSAPVAKCIGAWLLGAVLVAAAVVHGLVGDSGWMKEIPQDLLEFLSSSLAKTVFCVLAAGFFLYPFIIRRMLAGKTYTVTSQRVVDDDTTYWYRDLRHVSISHRADSLCDLILTGRAQDESADAVSRIKLMYLPQDAAEYVCEHYKGQQP